MSVNYRLHILIPTFNRAEMVERTIERLTVQDADPAMWHLTVVDNASTDQTEGVLARIQAKLSNFDYVVNERNLGLFGNLNRCMDLARTEKYMILHSDDDVDSSLVSSVLGFLDSYPDVQLAFGSCRAKFVGTGKIIPNWYRVKSLDGCEGILGSKVLLATLLTSSSNFIFAPTVIYDRSFFSPSLRYSYDYQFTADLDLWFRAAQKDPIVGYMPIPHITCGIHDERLSHKHSDVLRAEALLVIRKHLAQVQQGADKGMLSARLVWFIKWKLLIFAFAARFGLVPGFRVRRAVWAILDRVSPQVQRDSKRANS